MSQLVDTVLGDYFRSHRSLVDAEQEEPDTVVVSLPMYYSGNHRVELSVMRLPSGDFQISDDAKTLSELKLAGVPVTAKTKERITRLAKNAHISFVGNAMIRECTATQLGDVLHLFADAAKTVGDAYLVHRASAEPEDELRSRVKRILIHQNYVFREFEEVPGEVETHEVDFYMPPNGVPGLALSVLPRPTRLLAEAWAFKAADIRAMDVNRNLRVGLVYAVETIKERPRDIINKKIDLPIPSSDLEAIDQGLVRLVGK